MVTKQKLVQTRAGQTRGLGSRSRRHRPPRERWEEARGGRRPRPTMEDPSPDDAGQKTVRRSRRAGRDEGGSRTLRRSAGGCTKRLRAAGTRGGPSMWKTASATDAAPAARFRPHEASDGRRGLVCSTRLGGDWVLAESEQLAPAFTAEEVLRAYLTGSLQKEWKTPTRSLAWPSRERRRRSAAGTTARTSSCGPSV